MRGTSAKACAQTGLSQALKQAFDGPSAGTAMASTRRRIYPTFLLCAEQTGPLLVVGNRMPNARAIPLAAPAGEPLDEPPTVAASGQAPADTHAVSGSSTSQPGRPCRSRRNILKWNPKR